MAVRVENEKGFLVITMSVQEAVDVCHFGFAETELTDGCLICDNCNADLKDESLVYYVPVLNRLFCTECYKEWYATATRYDEDIPYEEKYFNYYAKLLNLIAN